MLWSTGFQMLSLYLKWLVIFLFLSVTLETSNNMKGERKVTNHALVQSLISYCALFTMIHSPKFN